VIGSTMRAFWRRPGAPLPAEAPSAANDPAGPGIQPVIDGLAREAGLLGREAAEVRGAIEDADRLTQTQTRAAQALAGELADVLAGQQAIVAETLAGVQAVERARAAVDGVGAEVEHLVATLREVGGAASQITRVALQTRLVAFNASVEAKRAGDAGRGFGVVADAVKDLASAVEASSKQILGTVGQLDARIATLAREIQRDQGNQGGVHAAFDEVDQGVGRIAQAAERSREACGRVDHRMRDIVGELQKSAQALGMTFRRTDTFLDVAERLIQGTAACGVETDDTPFIRAVQQAAGELGALLEAALDQGQVSLDELFDEQYQPVPGSAPQQHTTRFSALADRLFPGLQERMLGLDPRVAFCIAADRNGYIACHNAKYNHPQRPGELLWNTANARNRRIFNDRTGLASGRNTQPFLLQTYRRDMGGGQFMLLKEAAAPIGVRGRHWGGLRLAYRF
jgi:methyl-accepting chemotaxis protein